MPEQHNGTVVHTEQSRQQLNALFLLCKIDGHFPDSSRHDHHQLGYLSSIYYL
jgi:hypothetical protein